MKKMNNKNYLNKGQSQLTDDGDYNVSEERYGEVGSSGGGGGGGHGMEVQLFNFNKNSSQHSSAKGYNKVEVDMNSPDSPLRYSTKTNIHPNDVGASNLDASGVTGDNEPFGSECSDAEKYADRNSDPGIDCLERELLPVGNGGQYTMTMAGAGLYDAEGPVPPTGGAPGAGAVGGGLAPGLTRGGGGGTPTGNESVSLGTATQTHEVRMPMLLSTFKPATGCTNASDFIVRCFVARLRSGITVVKHGRSRWCKSRLRILHVHQDGRSLSWKPALGEPSSGKRPPKLDLTTCREVRHAWSPDPDNPMFTGTPILRQKCEAANAHKSFALIFPKRTVDITAVTADQCKVLMEGFSALCFRLQLAQTVAGGDGKKGGGAGENTNEEDRATAVTVSSKSDKGVTPKLGKKRS